MSKATTVMQLYLAESAALELQRLLLPGCRRVAVAGSVRRRKAECNDIEIVAVPKLERRAAQPKPGELFSKSGDTVVVNLLDELLAPVQRGDHPVLLLPKHVEGLRKPAWGERYRQLFIRHQRRFIKVDLWITNAHRFGAIYAIRTGDAEFSRMLVTKRREGGAMPDNMRQKNGELQALDPTSYLDGEPTDDDWQALYTPEESDYFGVLGLPVLNPEERNESNLRKLLQSRRHAATA